MFVRSVRGSFVWLRACVFVCLVGYLFACLLVCLCVFRTVGKLFGCLGVELVFVHSCLCVFACLFVCLLACVFVYSFAGLRV